MPVAGLSQIPFRSQTRTLAVFLISVGSNDIANSEQTATNSAQEDSFSELLDEIWNFEVVESPLLATNVGDPRGQSKLSDDSIEAIQRRHFERNQFLTRLKKFNPKTLSDLSQIDYELTKLRLSSQLDSFEFESHLLPINNREGFHLSFPELAHVMQPESIEDFQNYLNRLLDFPRYTNQQITLMRLGIERGLTQPAIIMRDSASQAESQVVDDPTASIFFHRCRGSGKTDVEHRAME